MADLENLRKQAKQIVRWHHQRHFPVAQTIRENLPRFAELDDIAVLDSPFRLADAQELLARKAGFNSWQDLSRCEDSTGRPDPSLAKAKLLAAEPQLFVQNMEASVEHYGKMGFSVAFLYGEPPFYGQVKRDGAALNFRLTTAPVLDPKRAGEEEFLAASITVDDAKQLFLEFKEAGVPFAQSLRKEPWGARTFIVKDPDGNLILFAGD
jgi:catechol 2,3-dioxygenase-like lactoylglutathione lyase family enzyme